MSHLRYVIASGLILGGILLLSSFGHADRAKEPKNTCVDCHSKLPGKSFVGVKSHNWKGSIHQEHGVTCDKCHGGNPNASDEKTAHMGVLKSSEPQSRVYFKKIPGTCGTCHGAEYYSFSQSYHYKMLEAGGRGPNCVTCHGSMTTAVLNPDDIANVCERCHNKRIGVFPYVPQKAKAVLLLLRESKALLIADTSLYNSAESSANAAYLKKAQSSLYSAKLEWHRFRLDAIIGDLEQLDNSLRKLRRNSPHR